LDAPNKVEIATSYLEQAAKNVPDYHAKLTRIKAIELLLKYEISLMAAPHREWLEVLLGVRDDLDSSNPKRLRKEATKLADEDDPENFCRGKEQAALDALARQIVADCLVPQEASSEELDSATQSQDPSTYAATTLTEDAEPEEARFTTRSDSRIGHYEHYAIVDLHRAIMAANDERDDQNILLHLDLLRLLAESSPALRAPIATITSDLLHRRRPSPGLSDSIVQQQCINILAACFAHGPPFEWNVREQANYPKSLSCIRGLRWSPFPLKLKLDHLRFADADFSGIHFTGVDFRETTFVRCQFVGCRFEACDLSGVRMESCQLTDIKAVYALVYDMVDTKEEDTTGRTINYLWEDRNIPSKPWHDMSCIFKFCLFQQAVMELTEASGSCFWGCDLSRAQIGPKGTKVQHKMRHVDFSGSDLSEAKLGDLDLAECLFIGCDLRYTSFKNGRLFWATIDTPLLKHAFFEGADLRDVFGLERHLNEFAKNTIYDKKTLLPPSLMSRNETTGNE